MDGVDAQPGVRGAVGESQQRDQQRDVGLHGSDDIADRRLLLADEREQPVARLDERREGLDRVERFSQATAVALATVALLGGRGFAAWGRMIG